MALPLPEGLGHGAWLWLVCVFFGAGVVRGFSGFGLSALIMVAGSLVMEPMRLVPMLVLVELLLTLQQTRAIRAHADWRRVLWLFAGCLAGVPLGVALFARVSPDMARIVIAGFVLAICALLLRGWRMARPAGGPAHLATGVASGVANGAAVGGLPVAAFFAAQPVTPAAFRATNLAYFALLDLWSLPVLALAGHVGAETFGLAAVALPFMVAGVWLGGRQFNRAAPQDFRRFAIILLAGLALVSLARSLFFFAPI